MLAASISRTGSPSRTAISSAWWASRSPFSSSARWTTSSQPRNSMIRPSSDSSSPASAAACSRYWSPPSKSIATRIAIASARTGPGGRTATSRSASASARDLSRRGAMQHDVERPADPDLDIGRWREPHTVAGEVRRQSERAAPGGTRRGVVELGRNTGVRVVAREREVPRPGVTVVDDTGERGVERLPLARRHAGQHRRREQRVGEPDDEIVTDHEQPVVDRGGHRVEPVLETARPGDGLGGARPERRGDTQHVPNVVAHGDHSLGQDAHQ